MIIGNVRKTVDWKTQRKTEERRYEIVVTHDERRTEQSQGNSEIECEGQDFDSLLKSLLMISRTSLLTTGATLYIKSLMKSTSKP